MRALGGRNASWRRGLCFDKCPLRRLKRLSPNEFAYTGYDCQPPLRVVPCRSACWFGRAPRGADGLRPAKPPRCLSAGSTPRWRGWLAAERPVPRGFDHRENPPRVRAIIAHQQASPRNVASAKGSWDQSPAASAWCPRQYAARSFPPRGRDRTAANRTKPSRLKNTSAESRALQGRIAVTLIHECPPRTCGASSATEAPICLPQSAAWWRCR